MSAPVVKPTRVGVGWMTSQPVRPFPTVYPTGWFAVVSYTALAPATSAGYPAAGVRPSVAGAAVSQSLGVTLWQFDTPGLSGSSPSAGVSVIGVTADADSFSFPELFVDVATPAISQSGVDAQLGLGLGAAALSESDSSGGLSVHLIAPAVSFSQFDTDVESSGEAVSVSVPDGGVGLNLGADTTSVSVAVCGFDPALDGLCASVSGGEADLSVVCGADAVSVSVTDAEYEIGEIPPQVAEAVSVSSAGAAAVPDGLGEVGTDSALTVDGGAVPVPAAAFVSAGYPTFTVTGLAYRPVNVTGTSTGSGSGTTTGVRVTGVTGTGTGTGAGSANPQQTYQTFSANLTLPVPSWAQRADVVALGGGCGGGGSSLGAFGYLGFGGKWAYTTLDLTPAGTKSLSITVGVGGAAGGTQLVSALGSNATPGGNSVVQLTNNGATVFTLTGAGGQRPAVPFFSLLAPAAVRNLGGAPVAGNSRSGCDVVYNGFTYASGGRQDANAAYPTSSDYTNGWAGSTSGANSPVPDGLAPGGGAPGGHATIISAGPGGKGAAGVVHVRFYGATVRATKDLKVPPFVVEDDDGCTDEGYVIGYPHGEGNPLPDEPEEPDELVDNPEQEGSDAVE